MSDTDSEQLTEHVRQIIKHNKPYDKRLDLYEINELHKQIQTMLKSMRPVECDNCNLQYFVKKLNTFVCVKGLKPTETLIKEWKEEDKCAVKNGWWKCEDFAEKSGFKYKLKKLLKRWFKCL